MKIELKGDYGTREHPDERVTIYCVDAPGDYPVHGRIGELQCGWDSNGTCALAIDFDLFPLQAKPLTQPSVNWDHIADKWNAMAKDKGGSVRLYEHPPVAGRAMWFDGGAFTYADALASLDPGTCDWSGSLVKRPT